MPTYEPTSKPSDAPHPVPTVVPGDPTANPTAKPSSSAPSHEPTAPTPMPTHSFGKAYAHYTYHSWDASTNTWYDTSGNDFHSNVATGTVAAVSETASGGLNYLSGGTSDSICLSDSYIIASTFTICSLSKYTSTGNRNRIIQSSTANWLHGQWNAQSGVAYYEGWQTSYSSTVSDAGAWLLFCGQNGGSGYFRANGETVAQSTSGRGNQKLCVNTGVYPSEVSEWAVAEIITWDRALSLNEIIEVEAHLGEKFSLAPLPASGA